MDKSNLFQTLYGKEILQLRHMKMSLNAQWLVYYRSNQNREDVLGTQHLIYNVGDHEMPEAGEIRFQN